MQTAQMSPPRFGYEATSPLPRKLDDFRLVHGSYGGSFSGKSKRPLLLAALALAGVVAAAFGAYQYSDDSAEKTQIAAVSSSTRVPTSTVPAATAPATAASSSSVDPVKPLARSLETIPTPPLTQVKPESNDAANSAKVKGTVPAKAASASTQSVTPAPSVRRNQVMPTPQEIPPTPLPTPLPTPAPTPPIIEEPPVIPAPAPVVPPAEPTKL